MGCGPVNSIKGLMVAFGFGTIARDGGAQIAGESLRAFAGFLAHRAFPWGGGGLRPITWVIGAMRASPTLTSPEGSFLVGSPDLRFASRSDLALATPMTLPVYMLNTGPPLSPAWVGNCAKYTACVRSGSRGCGNTALMMPTRTEGVCMACARTSGDVIGHPKVATSSPMDVRALGASSSVRVASSNWMLVRTTAKSCDPCTTIVAGSISEISGARVQLPVFR